MFDGDRNRTIRMIIPEVPPTRDRHGAGFVVLQTCHVAAITVLTVQPFSWPIAALAAAAVVSIVVSVSRRLGRQKQERITDQGRWQLLRKMYHLSTDDVAADARGLGLDVDGTAAFNAGAEAVIAHIRTHADAIGAQTARDMHLYY